MAGTTPSHLHETTEGWPYRTTPDVTAAELGLRFLIGGTMVSAFALLGEMVRPKSFAGLWGASPSIALASLGLTVRQQGHAYVALEARSMLVGSAAFLLYIVTVRCLLLRYRPSTLLVTLGTLPVWFAAGFLMLWLLRAGMGIWR